MSKDKGFVNIHGKQYKTVVARVNDFRESFPHWGITTDLIKFDGHQCVVKATITNEQGFVVATGLAHEHQEASQINGTSYVENCETSAIGRALAAFGLGGDQYASAEEVANAIYQQLNPKPKEDASKTNVDPPKTDIATPDTHSATDGAFNALDAVSQQRVKTRYESVMEAVERDDWDEAYKVYDEVQGEERIALKELMRPHSKIRTRLVKMYEERKAA